MNDIGVGVRHVLDGFCEFADRDAVTGADVDCFADAVVAGGGEEVCLDDIVDVGEVQGLFTIALNGDVVVSPRLVAEDGDDAAVVAALLALAVRVEISQGDRLNVVEFVIEMAVVDCSELIEPLW